MLAHKHSMQWVLDVIKQFQSVHFIIICWISFSPLQQNQNNRFVHLTQIQIDTLTHIQRKRDLQLASDVVR